MEENKVNAMLEREKRERDKARELRRWRNTPSTEGGHLFQSPCSEDKLCAAYSLDGMTSRRRRGARHARDTVCWKQRQDVLTQLKEGCVAGAREPGR